MNNISIKKAICLYNDDSEYILKDKQIISNSIFRRKLSRLAKLTICAYNELGVDEDIPIVYGSAYGELKSTYNILKSISDNRKVLPMDFQNSVHNTAMSYFSIFYKNKNSIDTVSAGYNTSYMTLWTAYIKLMADKTFNKILVFCADTYFEQASEIFDGFEKKDAESVAVILLEKKQSIDKNLLQISKNEVKLNEKNINIEKTAVPSNDFIVSLIKNIVPGSTRVLFQ
jgi:hypothetical protein